MTYTITYTDARSNRNFGTYEEAVASLTAECGDEIAFGLKWPDGEKLVYADFQDWNDGHPFAMIVQKPGFDDQVDACIAAGLMTP